MRSVNLAPNSNQDHIITCQFRVNTEPKHARLSATAAFYKNYLNLVNNCTILFLSTKYA